MKNIFAVDLGYGRVKALSVDRQLEFPSVVGAWRDIRFRADVTKLGFLGDLAVEYNGQKLFLGDAAYRQSTPQVDMSQRRFISNEGMALMLATIAMLAPNEAERIVCKLIAGLPVGSFALGKGSYCQTLTGQHAIKIIGGGAPWERRIKIEQCKILPQPVGTIFNSVLSDSGALADRDLAASKIAVIDVGANTVDLCKMDSLDFIDKESTTYTLGVFESYKQLSLELYNTYGVEIPPEEIEPYLKNDAVKISGRFHNIAEVKERVFRIAAEQIASRAKNVWRNLWQLDRIIISGGGANLFGNHIAQALDCPGQIVISERGAFSNVLGYLKYGRRTWGNG